jgi:hypothetical protein
VFLSDLAAKVNGEGSNSFRILAADATEAAFAQLLYQQIDAAESRLVVVYTRSHAEVSKNFEPFARNTGYSIYSWTLDRGFISLRENGVVVPGTRRMPDALRFIQQSAHFGVYLVPCAGSIFTPPLVAQLRQVARIEDGVMRKIVLLSEDGDIPATLSSYCAHVQIEPRSRAPLRLRDGRWIR